MPNPGINIPRFEWDNAIANEVFNANGAQIHIPMPEPIGVVQKQVPQVEDKNVFFDDNDAPYITVEGFDDVIYLPGGINFVVQNEDGSIVGFNRKPIFIAGKWRKVNGEQPVTLVAAEEFQPRIWKLG